MEFIRRMLGMTKSKPLKIQDVNGKKRVGIVASNYKELEEKGISRLELSMVNSIVLEEDGTEVEDDEYFSTLEPQTVLVFLKPGEVWEGYISYLKLASDKIIENVAMRNDTITAINKIFNGESPELSLLVDYVNASIADVDLEDIQDDPKWFDGINKSFKTKSSVMRESAKSRIRGYLSTSKDYASKVVMKKKTRNEYNQILDDFQNKLKECGYFGEIFDRSSSEKSSKLCDNKGWFNCEGAYDVESCNRTHKINPYLSKDTRVLFSTWNLDHQIEKSREILPKLQEAIENRPTNKKINWKYFFRLLFTLENLKLVDIRCHKKEKHTQCVVDMNCIYE